MTWYLNCKKQGVYLLEQKKPSYFSLIDLLPWIWYKRQLGQILLSEFATIFQKIYVVCLGISKCSKKDIRKYDLYTYKSIIGSYLHSFYAFIHFHSALLCIFVRPLNSLNCLNGCLKMITSVSRNLYYSHFFTSENNKYYTTILIDSSYPAGENLLILRVNLL